jgi:hypothetical protein
MPDAREMKAQKYTSTSRAGTPLGRGDHIGVDVAFEQAQNSEGDHSRRKDRMTHARDAHRPILRVHLVLESLVG